jgi:hypothetical protein
MGKVIVGCCGWSYGDLAEKGGWVGAFYPGTSTIIPSSLIRQRWIPLSRYKFSQKIRVSLTEAKTLD